MNTTDSATGAVQRKLPGEAGIWVFILGDMMMFGLFFIVFSYYRTQSLDVFLSSQRTLDQNIGALNTLLLLTSSWFVAKGIHIARSNPSRPSPLWFLLGFSCGLGFVVNKVIEYHAKLVHGITLTTNDFYMYYYVLTGIHLVHVLIGMGVLLLLWRMTSRPLTGKNDIALLESGGVFWHLVDLLWIVLFPLLYLVR